MQLVEAKACPAGIKIGNKTLDKTWMSYGKIQAFQLGWTGSNMNVVSTIGPTAFAYSFSGNSMYVQTGVPSVPCITSGLIWWNGTTIGLVTGTSIADANGLNLVSCYSLAGAILALGGATAWQGNIQFLLGSSTFG